MEYLDLRELEIKNFFSVKHFKAKMTPLMVFYGQNGAGKSTIAKLIYSLQRQCNYRSLIRGRREYVLSRGIAENLHLENLLRWIEIQRINSEEALEVPLGSEYFINYFEDLLKEQFTKIPLYFNADSWKTLFEKTKKKECTFTSTTSIFGGTVTITREEEDILIKPKLTIKNGVDLCVIKTNQRGESGRNFILSAIWDDTIFCVKEISISFRLKNGETKSFELGLQEKDSFLMSAVIHKAKIDWDSLRTVKNKGFTSLINNTQNSSIDLQLIEEVLENVRNDHDFKEKMSHRILNKIDRWLLDIFNEISPFNLFPSTHDALFIPPERIQILTDFEEIIQNMSTKTVRDSNKQVVPNRSPEISEFIAFLCAETSQLNSSSKKSAKTSELLQRFREIQQETYPIKKTNNSGFSFYDKRNDQIKEYGEIPSSVSSLIPLDFLFRRDILSIKELIVLEELEKHLHPHNIEKLCSLITDILWEQKRQQSKRKTRKYHMNMVITTNSLHTLYFLLLNMGLKVHPNEIKKYYTVVRFEFIPGKPYSEGKTIDISEKGYNEDPFVTEEIKIEEYLLRWEKMWKKDSNMQDSTIENKI